MIILPDYQYRDWLNDYLTRLPIPGLAQWLSCSIIDTGTDSMIILFDYRYRDWLNDYLTRLSIPGLIQWLSCSITDTGTDSMIIFALTAAVQMARYPITRLLYFCLLSRWHLGRLAQGTAGYSLQWNHKYFLLLLNSSFIVSFLKVLVSLLHIIIWVFIHLCDYFVTTPSCFVIFLKDFKIPHSSTGNFLLESA